MRPFIIISIILVSFIGIVNIYADDTATQLLTSESGKDTDAGISKQANKNEIKHSESEVSEYSDYPKSYIIPKGVCETDIEPAMVINNQ